MMHTMAVSLALAMVRLRLAASDTTLLVQLTTFLSDIGVHKMPKA